MLACLVVILGDPRGSWPSWRISQCWGRPRGSEERVGGRGRVRGEMIHRLEEENRHKYMCQRGHTHTHACFQASTHLPNLLIYTKHMLSKQSLIISFPQTPDTLAKKAHAKERLPYKQTTNQSTGVTPPYPLKKNRHTHTHKQLPIREEYPTQIHFTLRIWHHFRTEPLLSGSSSLSARPA